MSFGQTSGPPASAKQIALLPSLLDNDGFDFALLVLELLDLDDRLGLQSDVDHDEVGTDGDDETGEDLARLDTLGGQALFKQFSKRFTHGGELRAPQAPPL